MWGRLLGSNRILFIIHGGQLPDNCLIDVSSGEDLGHMAEQPEVEGGPLHKGPLELRHLVQQRPSLNAVPWL